MKIRFATTIGLVGVAIAGGVVAVVMLHKPAHPPHHRVDTTAVSATSIDEADVSVSMVAMLNAPEAATPCETAYGAVDAEQAAAKLRGSKSLFKWVAPKPDFLARCQALAPEAQRCMMPRYRRDHSQDCLIAEPSEEIRKTLVIGVPVAEPSYVR
jgi:hypothetical protein